MKTTMIMGLCVLATAAWAASELRGNAASGSSADLDLSPSTAQSQRVDKLALGSGYHEGLNCSVDAIILGVPGSTTVEPVLYLTASLLDPETGLRRLTAILRPISECSTPVRIGVLSVIGEATVTVDAQGQYQIQVTTRDA